MIISFRMGKSLHRGLGWINCCGLNRLVSYETTSVIRHTYDDLILKNDKSGHKNAKLSFLVWVGPCLSILNIEVIGWRRLYEARKESVSFDESACHSGRRTNHYHKFADKLSPAEYIDSGLTKRDLCIRFLTFQLFKWFSGDALWCISICRRMKNHLGPCHIAWDWKTIFCIPLPTSLLDLRRLQVRLGCGAHGQMREFSFRSRKCLTGWILVMHYQITKVGLRPVFRNFFNAPLMGLTAHQMESDPGNTYPWRALHNQVSVTKCLKWRSAKHQYYLPLHAVIGKWPGLLQCVSTFATAMVESMNSEKSISLPHERREGQLKEAN